MIGQKDVDFDAQLKYIVYWLENPKDAEDDDCDFDEECTMFADVEEFDDIEVSFEMEFSIEEKIVEDEASNEMKNMPSSRGKTKNMDNAYYIHFEFAAHDVNE